MSFPSRIKSITLILSLLFCLTFAASCGDDKEKNTQPDDTTADTTSALSLAEDTEGAKFGEIHLAD